MTQSMALPSEWVDRLFLRLSVMYGAKWAAMWDGVPLADVKDGWATALARFSGETLGRALENCGQFPPTLPEFVEICRTSAVPSHHYFPALPAPEPTRNNKAAHKAFDLAKSWTGKRKGDGRDWAREIVALHKAGQYRSHYGLDLAREALSDIGEAA